MMSRDPDFKCMICGKYVSYDRRKTVVENRTLSIFDSQEQYCPEEIVEMYHKKCYKKPKR